MKCYIIAGETSGDQHGAALIRELSILDSQVDVRGIGGDSMSSVGASILFHFQEIALMGVVDLIPHFIKLKNLINSCKEDLILFQPDVIILIDSAGFNLRIAKFAKKKGFRVLYFIPPKVWAWGQWRIKTLKKYTDQIFVTLPFEQHFFEKNDLQVTYHGSPISERMGNLGMKEKPTPLNRLKVALLPGSRRQEISAHMSVLIKVAKEHPEYNFIICGVDTVPKLSYLTGSFSENIEISFRPIEEVLSLASIAIVASGTATLETCLLRIPQIVIYKTRWLNYFIAKLLININYISLVNLIANRCVVQEFIQGACNSKKIGVELSNLINNEAYRKTMLAAYDDIAIQLPGHDTYRKIARDVVRSGGFEFTQI